MALFKERLYCPVCNTWLGDRDKDELFIGHCKECHAGFTWKPKLKKPIASLDRDIPVRCGCGTCQR
jgi:hypothetical protein